MSDLTPLSTVRVVDDGDTPAPSRVVHDLSRPELRQIGQYVLTGVLGSGGMGVVYRAEQQEPLRRDVALKLIRRGLDTDRLIARFEAERLALARMSHSGIARVFDAGATEDGRPYFVMELVRGQSLTAYCDEQRLTIRDRLALFVDTCRAVQHAHQKGIIHRDLKPSNILVSVEEGRPVPKVIDFGVAKALADDDDSPLLTREGQIVGTPAYMSPEQAGVVRGDVDTRADVYALGVVLYELLAGHQPHHFETGTRDEVQRVLRERTTARPSTAYGKHRRLRHTAQERPSAESLAEIAAKRQTTPDRLRRMLVGDLDTIVLKAMAFEPARRYASVDQLAEDVERYLQGHPVQARPDSLAYRTRKFVARHRVAVAFGALGLIALTGFAVEMAIQSARLERERDRTARALARAEAVNGFLMSMFAQADPRVALGPPPTAEQMLERAAERLGTELASAPDVRAQLLQSLANVYKQLARYDRSEELNVMAVELRRAAGSPLELADSLDALGDVRRYAGRPNEAVAPLEEALALRRQHLPPGHRDLGETLNNLGLVRNAQGRYEEAEALHRQSLAIWEALDTRESEEDLVALGLTNLGRDVRALGRSEEAAAMFERALRIREARLKPGNPRIGSSYFFLALTHADAGRLAEAARLMELALANRAPALGTSHPNTLSARAQLAHLYLRLGRLAAARREALTTLDHSAERPEGSREARATAERVLHDLARRDADRARATHDEAPVTEAQNAPPDQDSAEEAPATSGGER